MGLPQHSPCVGMTSKQYGDSNQCISVYTVIPSFFLSFRTACLFLVFGSPRYLSFSFDHCEYKPVYSFVFANHSLIVQSAGFYDFMFQCRFKFKVMNIAVLFACMYVVSIHMNVLVSMRMCTSSILLTCTIRQESYNQ